MKNLVICFLVSTAIFVTGCSKEEEMMKDTRDFQSTEQEYQSKVAQMKGILKKYGGVEDPTHPYDFYRPENKAYIEKLDLEELERFFIELHSEEGLKNVDEQFIIKKVNTNETKATTQYQVTGKHSNSIIGESSSFVNFTIENNENITFVSAGASYDNSNVRYDSTNGSNVIPFYPDASLDYYEHKGGINVSCKVVAFGSSYTAEMQARFNRNGSGSVTSFRA